jgi:hypothetical protein
MQQHSHRPRSYDPVLMMVYQHMEEMECQAAHERLARQARAHARATRPPRPPLALRVISAIRSLPDWGTRRGRMARDGAGCR